MTSTGATLRPGRGSARPNAMPIYLDNQSSTRLDPRVLEAMLPYFTEQFGNPHSASHAYGRVAAEAIEQARDEVAALINADPREVIFTSGATEANNLAIKGAARFARQHPRSAAPRDHIVTLTTEHKCVLESSRQLKHEGFTVTYLPVESSGLVSLDALTEALTARTLLVSVMAAHNEIGSGSHRLEHMARADLARRAGGSGADHDAIEIEGDDLGLGGDTRHRDRRGVGQSRYRGTENHRVGCDRSDTRLQTVA